MTIADTDTRLYQALAKRSKEARKSLRQTKALTLWQPWASLVLPLWGKQYETRGWSTDYRGPLVIHSAKRFERDERWLCFKGPFRSCLNGRYGNIDDLPLGQALGFVDLVDVIPVEKIRDELSDQERAFGDYSNGRYAWKFENPRPFPKPIEVTGKQKLWNWPMHSLFTYGYTGSWPEHLKQASDLFGATVLDIRRAARSMSPKWRKGALIDLLGDAYIHDNRLGNVNYKERGKPIEFLNLEDGIDSLIGLLLEKPVILLCGCQDYKGCHRTKLAEIMAEQYGVKFNHL